MIRVKEPSGHHTEYNDPEVRRIIEACNIELSLNFDQPARNILGIYAAKLGLTIEQLNKMRAEGAE